MKMRDKTNTKPDNDRFVTLILADGKQRVAQYIPALRSNIFRSGDDWFTRKGKFAATGVNPAVSWKELGSINMKKFILRWEMIYVETAEIKAESWDEAKAMLLSGTVLFERQSDGIVKEETIEFIGEEDTIICI